MSPTTKGGNDEQGPRRRTNTDSALVLIDYQRDQFESIRSETPADLIELNTRWLIRAAKAFDVPIVLSTIGVSQA